MHTYQHIFRFTFQALLVAVFIYACIKAPRQTIGAVVGGLVGVLIPVLCAVFYIWAGGDSQAAGVFSFFCILTVPMGIIIGVVVVTALAKRKSTSNKDKV
jgi:heme O synthase-like polyprenyltransferase